MTRPRRRPAPRPTPGPAELEIEIDVLGAKGDGIATSGGRRVVVPGALPGDRLRVRVVGPLEGGVLALPLEWEVRAPRAVPACPHFGSCGGCVLQHMPDEAQRSWKREQVQIALARRGLDPAVVATLRQSLPASRRRTRLVFARKGGVAVLGLHERRSRRIVDLAACPVLLPAIAGLLPGLRALLGGLAMADPGGEVEITACEGGLDVVIASEAAPRLADRERLAAFAAAADLARLSSRGRGGVAEPIVQRRPCVVELGGIRVALPPGAFLQATAEGEAALVLEVLQAVRGAGRVADLHAGLGTFALAIAATGAQVLAVERDKAATAALAAAASAAGLGARLRVETRDLERRPLAGAELRGLDALVLDPPRAGAPAQARALAAELAGPPVVAMASCAPPTFARDARILVDGGWRLERVVPVDQFLWSASIELVSVLRRPS